MLYPLFVLRHVPCFRSTFSVPSCHRPRAHRSKPFARLFSSCPTATYVCCIFLRTMMPGRGELQLDSTGF
jgi:hypothetical protein